MEAYNYLDYLTPDDDLSIVNSMINGVDLFDNQLKAAFESVYYKGGIWTVEMGLGKTMITLGVLTLLAPLLADKITIITAPPNTVISFYEKVKACTQLRPIYTSGKFDEVAVAINKAKSGEINCIVCTKSIWESSLEFIIYLYNNLDRIGCMIYDECRTTEKNKGFKNFLEIAHLVPYVFPANATVFSDSDYSIYALYYAIHATNNSFREFRKQFFIKKYIADNTTTYTVKIDALKQAFPNRLINFNRNDVNADAIYKAFNFHHCQLTSVQAEYLQMSSSKKSDILYVSPLSTIPPMSIAAFKKAMEIIMQATTLRPDENRILYCWHQQSAETFRKVFQTMGIPTVMLNGYATATPEEKAIAEETFNDMKGAIMITSVYDGTNLNSASHLIIYETPPEISQFIYRAVRGFNSKEIYVDWIYYPEFELDTIKEAYTDCYLNAKATGRDMTLANILKEELLSMNPDDQDILFN